MKPQKAVLRETGRVAIGVFALVGLMIAVFAAIGRFSAGVALGGLYTGALCVANFFVMGLTVQSVTDRAAERERGERELEELTAQMKNRMKLSYNLRMIALFALLVVGITLLHLDPLATILPVVFPTIVIRALQIIELKRKPVSKGSEEP